MPVALLVGPFAALIGIVAIFFVLRRKSVDKKRSMYSARRSQIEHKVRAARQRTLTPGGKAEKQPDAPPAPSPTSIFAPAPAAPRVTYEPSAYKPPTAAPAPPQEAAPLSWDVPAPAPPAPPATPAPPAPPPYAPAETPAASTAAPEAAPAPIEEVWAPAPLEPPPPSEAWTPAPLEPPPPREVWTPGPAPAEAAPPVEPRRPATPAASPGSWEVVSEASKEPADATEAHPKKKGKQAASTSSSWQLASGNVPGLEEEAEEEVVKAPSVMVAIAQYAVLVVGLVMVLIGVFVMIANSHVT
jgi:hypothetical protein